MKNIFKAFLIHIVLLIGLLMAGGQWIYGGVSVRFPTKPNLYIISVGIDHYQSGKFNLRYARADAVSIADEFEKRSAGIFQNINKVVLLDGQAGRARILNAFDDLTRTTKPDDVFVFHFSGMGSAHFLKQKEFYLFPADGVQDEIEKTGISSGQLQALFRGIRARTKLIILDSCDSAVGYESAASAFLEQDKDAASLIDENVLVIGTDQITLEPAELGHGVMTAIVLDGLKGDADCNGDGIVTNYELMTQMYNGGSKADKKDYHFSPRTIARGKIFELGYTDVKLAEIAAKAQESKEKNARVAQAKNTASGNGEQQSIQSRTKVVNLKGEEKEKIETRRGSDYAILFANDVYDNAAWSNLKNPSNDANDVARELRERYGFREVEIKRNLTTAEIYAAIKSYQTRVFENPIDDQLFIFFAGHGETNEYNNGFYVGRNSPAPLTDENENQFVSLDRLLTGIDLIPLQHIMVVFDACFAGQVWKPKIQLVQETAALPNVNENILSAGLTAPFGRNVGKLGSDFSLSNEFLSGGQTKVHPLVFAKQRMKRRSRIVLTSGDKPVPDGWRKEDGTISRNSPFADAFLQGLRTDGGKQGVLITSEFNTFFKDLDVQPQKGKLSDSDGDFVFVRPLKSPEGSR